MKAIEIHGGSGFGFHRHARQEKIEGFDCQRLVGIGNLARRLAYDDRNGGVFNAEFGNRPLKREFGICKASSADELVAGASG